MAQINKPSDYFNTALWTGTGAARNITDFGHDTDFVWIKSRASTYNHRLVDRVRGATESLYSDSTSAESTESAGVTGFITDGVSLGGDTGVNYSGNYVGWSWVAGGSASSNTDGSITTQVSANTAAGFSIVTYTGNGTAGATIGHGLNQAPEAFISKVRNQTNQWHCGFAPLGWTKQIHIDTTGASADTDIFNDTDPTSSVVTLGSASGTNWSGNTFVAYCFHSVKGFSKIGSYKGNGNADGTFVYTGFKPAFVIVKVTSTTDEWNLVDVKRDTTNSGTEHPLYPSSTSAESSGATRFDILSNGFKCRTTNVSCNGSGASYIYMAFAENPLVGTNDIPATAR